jgi:hypothetical protein
MTRLVRRKFSFRRDLWRVYKNGNVVGTRDSRAQDQTDLREFEGCTRNPRRQLRRHRQTALRETRDDYLASNPHAATLVEVKTLARDEFILEIEAIAMTEK